LCIASDTFLGNRRRRARANRRSDIAVGWICIFAPNTTASPDDGRRGWITPYLWFAGVNGTVGALSLETGVHASFGDIFSYFNIGLMGEVEARRNDFCWPLTSCG
jgi:hypothetical protein